MIIKQEMDYVNGQLILTKYLVEESHNDHE